MSDINTSVEQVTDDLDSFSNDFFGTKQASSDQESSEPASSTSEADIEDQDESESDVSNTDDTPQETDEPDDNDKPGEKPKKNRYQERINELTGGKRQAERERDELLARIRELENTKNNTASETPQETPVTTSPRPDDKLEDGSDKYPLGEFDPAFISDLTDYKLEQRLKMIEETQIKQRQQQEQEAQKTALQQSWNEQLVAAQERYPDLAQKAQELAPTFDGIDQAYGDYLANTLMQMDKGADVLYYLATNPDEAAQLVNMSPVKAAIALGRIESRFDGESKPSTPVTKVSQAPTPPPTNKGAAAVQASIPDDTDDLDAFAKKFFKKRR